MVAVSTRAITRHLTKKKTSWMCCKSKNKAEYNFSCILQVNQKISELKNEDTYRDGKKSPETRFSMHTVVKLSKPLN